MLALCALLALLLTAVVVSKPPQDRVPSERRHPEDRADDQGELAERRKDDAVGGEGG